jgi:hypothetical protein
MSKRIVDHDPLTGITTLMEYHADTDITVVSREQDVEPYLEMNKALQNDPEYSRKGMKEGWWHYAFYPDVVIEKFRREHGVDIFNPDHAKKKFELLNRPEYKYLKTTTKMHNVR